MVIRWMLRNAEVADEMADLHARLTLHVYFNARRREGHWPQDPTAPLLSAEEGARARDLFGRRGTRFPTGHERLEDLIEENLEHFDDEHLVSQTQAMFRVAVAWGDRMTHATGVASRAHRAQDPDDPDVIEGVGVLITGPSRHHVLDALHLASAAYMFALEAVVSRFVPDLNDAVARAGGMLWRAWKDPEELRRLAADDPCPCDKPDTLWGDCHAWTEEPVAP
jgi:hypothetical protein